MNDGGDGDDQALRKWFLDAGERGNPSSEIRRWTVGNRVEPLIDGANYFPRLYMRLAATRPGDQVYIADFRGDIAEELAGPDTALGAAPNSRACGLPIAVSSWR